MGTPLRVLIVEDSEDDAQLIARELTRAGYELQYERVETPTAMTAAMARQRWDLVLSDNSLPQFSGTAALKQLREAHPEVPFIFVSGTLGEDAAAEGMRAGAQDYLIKGKLERLVPAVERELRDAEMRRLRIRAEQALKESEATYRSLVEQSPYGIFRSTLEGRLLAVNPAIIRMLGYDSEPELLARNMVRDIYDDPDERAQLLNKLHAAGGQVSGEATWRRKDGRLITVRQTSRESRDAEGRTLYFDTIVEDISERRLLEGQLRQAQKMEAIGRLAGGVAHDFNNLLTAILGCADLMLESLPDNAAERQEAHEIHDAAIRAADLTRQLLAFSRQQAQAPQPINLNEVVAGVHRLLQRLIGEDIDLRVLLASDLGIARADRNQLEQVIVNLAVNARDAMPQGGKLTIETRNAQIDEPFIARHGIAGTPGPCVMVSVADTGIGMDAETQSRMFEPFFTTKPVGQGTGLGLATVYGIVKQSGGFIWVQSEVGRGTTFQIYFPRIAQPAESASSLMLTMPSLRGSETVLVVDDQPEIRKLTRRILEAQGYSVIAAASGGDALVLAEQHHGPIDLLVTDVIMPGMSGRELSLLLTPARPDMKVLFVSGYANQAIQNHGVLGPGVAFLQKPFSAEALARTVRAVLDPPLRRAARAS